MNFQSWGYLNGHDKKTGLEFDAERAMHTEQMKVHPDEHRMETISRGRCIEEHSCTCGFFFGVDSSD